MPLGYIPYVLNISEAGRKFTDKFEEWIKICPLAVIEHAKEIRTRGPVGNFLVRALILILEAVLCVIFLAFAVLIPASCTLLPIQSAMNLWWDIYDVASARAANAHIIVVNPDYRPGASFQNNDNPEHDWGFGQILPFVMLLLPLLTAVDYLSSMKSKRI